MTRGAFFHTARFGEPLADTYLEILESFRDLRKAKVLLIDFDNTLWEGVMADGVVTHRKEAQLLLRKLKDAGMLLVALSKNDPKNIRWDEMHLKPEDFALLKISWNLKAQGISEAAAELDLGIDSFVLVDDERRAGARARHRSASEGARARSDEGRDVGVARAADAFSKYARYRGVAPAHRDVPCASRAAPRAGRRRVADGLSRDDGVARTAREVRQGSAEGARSTHRARSAHESVQHDDDPLTKSELATLMSSAEHGVYTAEVVDKFGSFGTVAIIILSRKTGEIMIDSFVMSCRAMGFGLEQAFLRLVLDEEKHATRAIGKFVPTDRNQPSARVFADNGFRATDNTFWLLESGDTRPVVPDWDHRRRPLIAAASRVTGLPPCSATRRWAYAPRSAGAALPSAARSSRS